MIHDKYWFLSVKENKLQNTVIGYGTKQITSPSIINNMRSIHHLLVQHSNEFIDDWCEKGWRDSLAFFDRSRRESAGIGNLKLMPEKSTNDLLEIIKKRRSIRKFGGGIFSQKNWNDFLELIKHPVFSNLNKYFSYYFVVYKIQDLNMGIYKKRNSSTKISVVRSGDFTQETINILNGMETSRNGVFTMFLVLDINRLLLDFKSDSILRKFYLISGIICQDIMIKARSLKLESLVSPAINDSRACDLLRIPKYRKQALYSIAFGLKSKE